MLLLCVLSKAILPEVNVWQITFLSLLVIRSIIMASIIVVGYLLVIIEERLILSRQSHLIIHVVSLALKDRWEF